MTTSPKRKLDPLGMSWLNPMKRFSVGFLAGSVIAAPLFWWLAQHNAGRTATASQDGQLESLVFRSSQTREGAEPTIGSAEPGTASLNDRAGAEGGAMQEGSFDLTLQRLRSRRDDIVRGTCAPAPPWRDRGEDYLEQQMRNDAQGRFNHVLANPERYRAQILVSEVVRNDVGERCIKSYAWRLNREYFYPASAIKTVAAVASLLLIQQEEDPASILGSQFSWSPQLNVLQSGALTETSPQQRPTTLMRQLERTLVVSSNPGFNVLFDFVGMEFVNRAMWSAGLTSVRVQHRLQTGLLDSDSHRFAPPVRFESGNAHRVQFAAREATPTFRDDLHLDMTGMGVGDAYLDAETEERIQEPLDFSTKNYISLRDLQRIVLEVVNPALDGDDTDLPLTEVNRTLLREIMGSRPPAAENGTVEDAEARFKPLSPGVSSVIPRNQYLYINKAGRAWGFHLDSAYIEHLPTGRAFFVAVTLYVDEDGLLNDGRARYNEVSFPFFVALGEVLADDLLRP